MSAEFVSPTMDAAPTNDPVEPVTLAAKALKGTLMSHAMLPALRVKNAAEKALHEAGPIDAQNDSLFTGLIGLCKAVMADPKGDHDIAVDATDFNRIRKHYDFTDPRLITLHEHPSTARNFGK